MHTNLFTVQFMTDPFLEQIVKVKRCFRGQTGRQQYTNLHSWKSNARLVETSGNNLLINVLLCITFGRVVGIVGCMLCLSVSPELWNTSMNP